MLHKGDLGVHPAGALGVAFFVHTDAECLIGRGGDGITQPLKEGGTLNLLDRGRLRTASLDGRIYANLLEAESQGKLPELLFVCCNPDQLGLWTGELTRFLENLAQRGHLTSIEDIERRVPILLVLPNGILYEQTLQTYEEQLDESLLMQRLPGLDKEMIAPLLDRVVRGISLQAGGRRGSGRDTTYILEKKGMLLFAGGGAAERARVEAILVAHGYPFKHAHNVPGVRIEFDKAMISVILNVGGLIHTVKADGELLDLRMGDLCKDAGKAGFIEQVTRAVFNVGLSAGAYPADAEYEGIWATHRATILSFAGHMTSSLKTFREALERGMNEVKLFSNEEWILTPLRKYAANAGLSDEGSLFKSLKLQVQESMARAIRHRDQTGHSSGSTMMNLVAQRNISVELFESGVDELTAVGTMLDNEHLIKLEMGIFLPDEQITRSRLSMIRVPFPVCREVELVAETLVGLRVEPGVLNEIAKRIGGRVGCSHIKELASNLVYFIASHLVRRRAGVDPMSYEFIQKPPEERFSLTKDLLRDSCLAYCQTTALGLDEAIGIRRVGEEHTCPAELGEYEKSLGVIWKDRAAQWGDRAFMRAQSTDGDRTISWTEFGSTVSEIARGLIDQGIRPGDRIAMISENRPEMFVFELAVMSIGAVTIPVFAGSLPRQVAYVLGHARPRFVVVSGMHQLEKIQRERHTWIRDYYCMDFDADCKAWGAGAFDTFTSGGGATVEELDARIAAVGADDLCLIMYTSGTTGPPKGVKLSHRNIISQQKAISLLWDVGEKDVLLSYLPWHHSFGGIFERFLSLYHGCELCIDDSRGRDISRLVENWKACDPTLFFSVPRVHDMLVTRCREEAEADAAVFGGRLRFVFTAGASLPATVESVYRQHNIPVVEGWGLTETSPSVTLTTADQGWKSGYVGRPIPGVSVRIDDDQEILVKGPNVMSGYLDDEEATAHVLSVDGWFRTGDLGEFTPNGLRILGRKDGAFKLTTGEKVHPQRIENIFVNECPFVSAIVALGSGEDFLGALVFPDMSRLRAWASQKGIPDEQLVDAPSVRELFANEMTRINPQIEVKYHRVRRFVLTDREPTLGNGELTPSGKLVRRAVTDHHKDQLNDMFSSRPSDKVIDLNEQVLQRT